MSRQSVAKAHQKIQELAWEPLYHEPVSQYGTDYTFQKAQKKDPLKQVLRSYFPMQEEKDHRVYGAQDGAIRGNMFRQVQERWLEWQKLFLSIIPLPEISAARAMPLLFRTVPNPELHNGQAIQMIDEVRHSTIQQNLKRLYMNNYIDPAGFNSSLRNFQNDYCGTIGRQFAEGFITGDAITAASIYLTIVAETAFTNTLFVAMPAEAAANGDYLLPTVFHSVQSDESRHISNGYATLLMALADESNHQLLERDLRYAWWNNHRVVDAAIGTFIEYGTKDRRKDRESYAEMWRRWIYDDYYRSYLVPLEKYGLVIPHDLIEEAWNQIWNKGYVHEVAQFFATGWLANYWRIDPMTDKDFEWFEYKYPGWYDKYGKWWENYNRLSRPNGHHPIVAEDVDYQYPHRCWTCMVPCLIREDMVVDQVDGQWRTYCHEECRWTDAVAFRPTYQGRADAEHGPAHRAPRVGDALPRLELGRRGVGHGLRPRRRQDPGRAAAPGPGRPEEDVDAGPPAPDAAGAEPERPAQRRCPTRSARRSTPTTCAAARPAGPRPRTAEPGAPERAAAHGCGPRLQPARHPAVSPPGHRHASATPEGVMGDKHVVRFEPVGIEIEVDEEQTILRAAFEQGVMLMHGCKEGQCSACKSFVLDGDDIELDRYSTFALPDFEKEEGYTLLCRAHAYEDLTIELLNYDEDMIRSGLPIHAGRGGGGGQRPGHPRHAAPGAAAGRARGVKFFPGQYVDIAIPGIRRRPARSPWPTPPAGTAASSSSSSRSTRTGCSRTSSTPTLQVGDRLEPDRAVRGVHAARGRRRRPDLRRRRRRDGADPVAAALHGRARHQPQGHLLLRRPRHAGPVLRVRAAGAGGGAAELPLRPGAVRARRRTTTGTARPA